MKNEASTSTKPAAVAVMPYDEAYGRMLSRNRANRANRKAEPWVVVDGPLEGMGALMTLRAAVDAGFCYSWAR